MAYKIYFKKPKETKFRKIGLNFTENQATMESANLLRMGFDVKFGEEKRKKTIIFQKQL